ncbi:hypothetical protein [Calidithermus timidus]|jgi:hypothetical protein|uniref:hypothetical protein n=1 Tax=Calidithermus timidus TaxID=307124 RepID=UPI0003633ADB|nr:hypothetical protein [Calidithermus timidus]
MGRSWISWVVLGVLLLGPDPLILLTPPTKAIQVGWSSNPGPQFQEKTSPQGWLGWLPFVLSRGEGFRLARLYPGSPRPRPSRPRARGRLFLLYRRLQLEGCQSQVPGIQEALVRHPTQFASPTLLKEY